MVGPRQTHFAMSVHGRDPLADAGGGTLLFGAVALMTDARRRCRV